MQIPTYEEWKAVAKGFFLEDHEERACPYCDGAGEVECCECGHEKECEGCKGSGKVFFEKSGDDYRTMPGFEVQDYYTAIMGEITRIAKWKGQHAYMLMLPIAREIQKEHPNAVFLARRKRAMLKKIGVLA